MGKRHAMAIQRELAKSQNRFKALELLQVSRKTEKRELQSRELQSVDNDRIIP